MKTLYRGIIYIIASVMMISFTACSKGGASDNAVTVGDMGISSDIYTYYLDQAIIDANDADIDDKEVQAEAALLCEEYAKVTMEFEKKGLKLSSSTKASVASEVNDSWSMFGGYYTKIGVSKQTLTKVKTCEAYKEDLVTDIYGKGGEKEISAAEQKKFFKENYIFFKAISAYLNESDDANAVKESFQTMKTEISDGSTIDEVNKAYVENNGGTTESEMEILSTTKNNDSYPASFFEDVAKMDDDAVSVLNYDNYVFLVKKINSEKYYSDYQKTNLARMADGYFNDYMTQKYGKLKIEISSSSESRAYNLIQNVKSK